MLAKTRFMALRTLVLVVAFQAVPAQVSHHGVVAFGPGGCVRVAKSLDGTCVLTTDCQAQVTDHFEFAFDCVTTGGKSVVMHSYGIGGFDAIEEFDTGVKCEKCQAPVTETTKARKAPPKPTYAAKPSKAAPKLRATRHAGRQTANTKKDHHGHMPHGLVAHPVHNLVTKHTHSSHAAVKETRTAMKATPVEYGPNNCVTVWKNPKGSCVMQTKCSAADTSKYNFGLVCADKAGMPVRHLFGEASFDPEETFDTLIDCDKCLGLDNIPAHVAMNGQVPILAEELKELKEVVATLSAKVDRLDASVYNASTAKLAGVLSTTTTTTAAPAAANVSVANVSVAGNVSVAALSRHSAVRETQAAPFGHRVAHETQAEPSTHTQIATPEPAEAQPEVQQTLADDGQDQPVEEAEEQPAAQPAVQPEAPSEVHQVLATDAAQADGQDSSQGDSQDAANQDANQNDNPPSQDDSPAVEPSPVGSNDDDETEG